MGGSRDARGRRAAAEPDELGWLFLEPANAGDVEGIVALYEPDPVLAGPGEPTRSGGPTSGCSPAGPRSPAMCAPRSAPATSP